MPEIHFRISIDPNICHGKPVITGTRTPVAVVLGHLAAGDDMDTICREYDLTRDDICAAIAFANEELSQVTFAPMLKATGS